MTARIIDGKAVAASVRAEVAERAAAFHQRHGRAPGLATVLVGEDAASRVYIRNKRKAAAEAGLLDIHHALPAALPAEDLVALLDALNADEGVDGILVQLPLPTHIPVRAIIDRIRPDKDVDGFSLLSAGRLFTGEPGLVPCTPKGAMRLLQAAGTPLPGAHAVVLGRSNIVGKPMAQLLLMADATVTVAHSRTADLPALCRSADVLVAAVGRAEMVRGDWVKPGATVIDVGINRLEDGRLVGDVACAEAAGVAGAITPVPGGVGPMTIACLLENTVEAAGRRAGA